LGQVFQVPGAESREGGCLGERDQSLVFQPPPNPLFGWRDYNQVVR
jgi:hypothetical protein